MINGRQVGILQMYYNGFTEALCMGIKKKTLKSTFLFLLNLLNLLTAIFLPLKRKKKKVNKIPK